MAVFFGILGGLILLGVAGVAIASNVLKDNGPTVARPAVAPTTESEGPGPFPTTKATLPTAPATSRRATAPVPTRTTPPPKPQPTANQVLTANRLYKTGVQRAVGCRESRGGLGTAAKASAYYRAIKQCLDRAWPRQIVAAGYQFRAPDMFAFTGRASTPCGSTTDGRAFYCPSNHSIYMAVASDMRAYRQHQAFGRALATHTVAHEYGHAMQKLTRVLSATYELQYNSSGAKKLELNRRMELQASCLGDVFLGTNRGSYGLTGQLYTQWLYIVNNSGDEYARGGPRDHGSRVSHGFWARRGFAARNPAFCNTFVAPANKVS